MSTKDAKTEAKPETKAAPDAPEEVSEEDFDPTKPFDGYAVNKDLAYEGGEAKTAKEPEVKSTD